MLGREIPDVILKTRVRASLEQALAETVTQALAEEMAKFENAKY